MRRYTRERDLGAFVSDEMAIDAVVRTLEIISEASRRLSASFKERYPDVPWSNVAAAGNVYRHDYEKVTPERIYETATSEIASLLTVLEREGLL